MRTLTPKERLILKEESAFVDICFAMLEDRSVREIAKACHLSKTTLYNLRKGVRPGTQAMTLRKLGQAAGLTLIWSKSKAQIRVNKKGKAA